MNSCQFVGRFREDPVLNTCENSHGGETSVTNFMLEISRVFRKKNGEQREQVYYFDFEAWDVGAELITEHFKKGDWITVHASAKTDSYQDKKTRKIINKVKFRINEFEIPRWTSNETTELRNSEPARI